MDDTPSITLFCVPHAGASAAATYGRWQRLLPSTIKVAPLELAGRGRRMPEPFYDSIAEAVADLIAKIAPQARSAPYAFYAHSMGTVIVYELVRALAAAGLPPPRALFLSGRHPPHYIYERHHLHLLSKDAFLQEIRTLGGTPEEFFSMPALVDAFVPILRSDYRMVELYRAANPLHVTGADIVFFHSDRDRLVRKPTVYDWRRYTSGTFALRDFEGDHFFINEQQAALCRAIGDWLELALAS
jgi:surfactin synthase thioesterase subunit